MSINNKNSNQNKFFKNMPDGLLQDTLPTMRNIIILLDNLDEQDEAKNEESASYSSTPSL